MAVCQPSVPVLAAVSHHGAATSDRCRAGDDDDDGRADRHAPQADRGQHARRRAPQEWFRDNVIMQVPWPTPGYGRDVYPGFLQLAGFMTMNLGRHIIAHKEMFKHLVKDDGESADASIASSTTNISPCCDMTAEFYLQTVDTVFAAICCRKGEMKHRGVAVDPVGDRDIALLTIEGENDDISGVGQTEAAHDLCVSIPADKKVHYVQPAVGHYGVFNGSRFRSDIVPRICDFIVSHGRRATTAKPRLVRTAAQ